MIWVQIIFPLVSLVVLANCNETFDLKLVPHDCLNSKAIAADYDPLGNMVTVGDLPVYEYDAPDNVNKKRLLIAVHDIYGLEYPNLKQVTDQIAIQSGGFRAILPDFYRGEAWNTSRNASERQAWIDQVGDWNLTVKPDLINLVNHYRGQGVEEFAIFGFCWGGRISTLASIELSDYFKASGLVHPSAVTNDQAEEVKIPMYLMPSMGESDMLPFYRVLQNKFGNNSGHRRFDDMAHGFAGSRGNFSDPVIRERVDEVITTLGAFFDRNLEQTTTTTDPSNSWNIRPATLLIMSLITSVFIISRT